MHMVRLIRATILLFVPTRWARKIVNRMGYRIAESARVGLSWVDAERLTMNDRAYIGHLNRITGDFAIDMDVSGKIGNANVITTGGSATGPAQPELRIGKVSGLTSYHFLDMTASITVGDFSALAGRGSQLWTCLSGYSPTKKDAGAARAIVIGRNVYVGSKCLLLGGIEISDGAIVGGGAAVLRDLPHPGLYVGSGIQKL